MSADSSVLVTTRDIVTAPIIVENGRTGRRAPSQRSRARGTRPRGGNDSCAGLGCFPYWRPHGLSETDLLDCDWHPNYTLVQFRCRV